MKMETREEINEQIRRLTAAVNEMRIRVATLEDGDVPSEKPTKRTNRRRFLTLGAGAALGAVGMAASRVLPAAALTGAPFLLGSANLAENPTTLQADGATPPTQVLAAEAAGFTATA